MNENIRKNHRFMRMRTRTLPAILVTVTSAVLGVDCYTHGHTHGHLVSTIIVRLLLENIFMIHEDSIICLSCLLSQYNGIDAFVTCLDHVYFHSDDRTPRARWFGDGCLSSLTTVSGFLSIVV